MFVRAVGAVAAVVILFRLGLWVGGGLTRNVPHGGFFAAAFLCAGWFGYLLWESQRPDRQKDTEAHQFIKAVISAALTAFLVAAFKLQG